jgi:hypothetical protein
MKNRLVFIIYYLHTLLHNTPLLRSFYAGVSPGSGSRSDQCACSSA